MFPLILERKGGVGEERDRQIAFCIHPSWECVHLSMRSDWEANQQTFGARSNQLSHMVRARLSRL